MDYFSSDFDVAPEPISKHHVALAHGMSTHWTTIEERDRAGKPKRFGTSINCNQEPCYEELAVQQLAGVPSKDLRSAALKRRMEMNGGLTPLSPAAVRRAVVDACKRLDEYRAEAFPHALLKEAMGKIGRGR